VTPDEARAAVEPLYASARYIDGGTLPHAEREALWKRAAALERHYATPQVTPRKREPDCYCFRCGEPVPGGLFVTNTRARGRNVSLVNVDRWDAARDVRIAHCGAAPEPAPAPPPAGAIGAQLAMFAAAPLTCPTCGARRVFSDSIDDASAPRRAYVCDACARTWSVDGAQLDLFADPVSAPVLDAQEDLAL